MLKKIKIITFITSIFLIILGLINILFTKNKSSIPTNTIPLTITSTQTSTSGFSEIVPQITKTPLTIDWTNTIFDNPNQQYLSYEVENLISEKTFDSIAKTLNFSTNQKNIIDNNNQIYKTQNQQEILLYTSQEQAINYQNLTKPINNNLLNDQSVTNKSKELINRLFPQLTFVLDQIIYYKSNYYSDPTTAGDAEIVQVYLTQTVDGFPLIPSNVSNKTVVIITYNKDLSLNNFILNNGYSKQIVPITKHIFDVEKLKKYSTNSLLSLTPLRLDKQDILDSAETANLSVSKVSVGYININQKLSPVYLISGILTTENKKLNQEVIYTAPIN